MALLGFILILLGLLLAAAWVITSDHMDANTPVLIGVVIALVGMLLILDARPSEEQLKQDIARLEAQVNQFKYVSQLEQKVRQLESEKSGIIQAIEVSKGRNIEVAP